MRTNPYPVPGSRSWSSVMGGVYLAIALSGALVLALIPVSPQPLSGVVTLTLWGGCTLPAAAAATYGVARSWYRWEWIGDWFIVLGTSVYLVVTAFGTAAAGVWQVLLSLPTMLIFLAFIGLVLARAVQLSLVDMEARRRRQAERTLTGEIPEVRTDG